MLQYIDFSNLKEAKRLFHGRGHAFANYSYINVDWLPPVVLITLYQAVEADWLMQLATDLQKHIPQAKSVQVQYRYQKMAPFEVLLGENIEHTLIQEHGLNYHIQLGRSQNTGLFLDMANGRKWLQQISKDKKVLNLFAYTCGFSVAAIAGGAKQVVNIDLSRVSLTQGRENHRANQHDLSKVVFSAVDIFKSWGRIKKYAPYDIVVCDPPSFQKGSVDIKRDYHKIIKRLPQWLAPKAKLLLCLNSPDLDQQFLLAQVAAFCPELQFVQEIKPPAEFIEAEQGKGLKALEFLYQSEVTE